MRSAPPTFASGFDLGLQASSTRDLTASPYELADVPPRRVARAFPGASFKTLPNCHEAARRPRSNGWRASFFLSRARQGAQPQWTSSWATCAFAPFILGKVSEGGMLIGMGGPLILQNLIKQG